MSKSTQDKFINTVDKAIILLSKDFNISKKNISLDGFVTRINYTFGECIVEFLCGPPEYHAEIFISVVNNKIVDRYDLTKLMSISQLKHWVTKNKPDISHGDKIKAEMDWYVLLLKKIKTLPEFQSISTV